MWFFYGIASKSSGSGLETTDWTITIHDFYASLFVCEFLWIRDVRFLLVTHLWLCSECPQIVAPAYPARTALAAAACQRSKRAWRRARVGLGQMHRMLSALAVHSRFFGVYWLTVGRPVTQKGDDLGAQISFCTVLHLFHCVYGSLATAIPTSAGAAGLTNRPTPWRIRIDIGVASTYLHSRGYLLKEKKTTWPQIG